MRSRTRSSSPQGVTPGGLGAAFVEAVAKGQPGLLILAGRNVEKTQQTADTIAAVQPNVKVRVLKLDLGSLAAVRQAADTVRSWADVPHIDAVLNNAGLMGTPFMLTRDGFESQFGTNHLGHFLFTNLIMDKILASPSPRVVNITSDGHRLNPISLERLQLQCLSPLMPASHRLVADQIRVSRMARRTTSGIATVSPRRPIC